MTEPHPARAVRWRTPACQTLAALGLAALAAACQPGGTTQEVQRLTSPDGALDAVIVERNHGATVPFVHEIVVLPKGAPASSAQPAVRLVGATRNENARGADLQWLSATALRVSYLQARQVRDQRSTAGAAGRQVQIVLQPGVQGAGLPPPAASAASTAAPSR